jgi:hypothetical protein
VENSPPTVNEVVEAIKKNGWPKTKRSYFRTSIGIGISSYVPSDIESACAMGQAALNLDMPPDIIAQVLEQTNIRASQLTPHEQNILRRNYRAGFGYIPEDFVPAGAVVMMLNDHTDMTVQQIGERLEELIGSSVGRSN